MKWWNACKNVNIHLISSFYSFLIPKNRNTQNFIQVLAYLLHIQYCFKIPSFSAWTNCVCGIHPARHNAVCSAEGVLKKHYSMILALSMHCEYRNLKISVQDWASTLVVHKGLYFFFILCLSRMTKWIVTSFHMFGTLPWWLASTCYFSFNFPLSKKSLY